MCKRVKQVTANTNHERLYECTYVYVHRYINISRKSSRTDEELYDNVDDVKMEINEAYSDSLRLSASYL